MGKAGSAGDGDGSGASGAEGEGTAGAGGGVGRVCRRSATGRRRLRKGLSDGSASVRRVHRSCCHWYTAWREEPSGSGGVADRAGAARSASASWPPRPSMVACSAACLAACRRARSSMCLGAM